MMANKSFWLGVENRKLRSFATDVFLEPGKRYGLDSFEYCLQVLDARKTIDELGHAIFEAPVEYYRRAAPYEVTNGLIYLATFDYASLLKRSRHELESRIPEKSALYVFWHKTEPVYVGMTRVGIRRVLYHDHTVRSTLVHNEHLLDDMRLYWYTAPFPEALGQIEYAVERALEPVWNVRHKKMQDSHQGVHRFWGERTDSVGWIDWDWSLPSWPDCLIPSTREVDIDPLVARVFADG